MLCIDVLTMLGFIAIAIADKSKSETTRERERERERRREGEAGREVSQRGSISE